MQRSEDGVGSSGTGVIAACEPELNLGPLEEQPVLGSTNEVSSCRMWIVKVS